ncbi:MAG: alpha/beta hydrolase [Rhodobacteraceae bacterium]|nr:alpha/beta hydrolase [Paracoccaceae bacterium]
MFETHPAPFHTEVADGPATGAALWVKTTDGVRIRVAHWNKPDAKGTVLMFPGRTEYIEKYGRTATAFAERGYAMAAIDWRGQGLADRLIDDRDAGYVEDFPDYQLDVAAMLATLEALDMPKPWFLLGHSMGGCIGLRAVMSGLPVNAAAFSAPMWGIQMSSAMRPAAWALSWTSRRIGAGERLAPGTKSETYVLAEPFEGNTLTHDPDMYAYMQEQMRQVPDMALGGPSLHWLNEALCELRSLAARPAPDMPCLTFLGTDEQIVDTDAIKTRMADWPDGELVMIDGGEHEVLMELPAMRDQVHDACAAFFDAHL